MRDIIVFGEDFGGLPSSTQHLVKHLSKERKVLWINSIGLRKPRLTKQDLQRAINKLFFSPKPHYLEPIKNHTNLTVTSIKTIPAPRYKWERALAASMMLKQLTPLISSLNLRNPILWMSLPTAVDLCGKLGAHDVVYYCGDDFGALAGVDHDTVLLHEALLSQKANLVLVASEALLPKFPKIKTHLIRHAVDHKLFSTAVLPAEDLPKEKPVVGFYGSISEWLDDEFIYQVASQKTDWNFVFIGPKIKSFSTLNQLSNILFLGAKAHHQLPSYSQHWQMSWLPFKNNAQIKACSPLKLMEYIAAGRPIAATKFEAVSSYQKQINTVENSQDMIDLLENESSWIMPAPQTLANEDWQARARQVSALLNEL